MKEQGKYLAIWGMIFQCATLVTTVGVVVAMISAYAAMNEGGSSEEVQTCLAQAISYALYAQAGGLVFSALGAILLFVALCVRKYRAKWFQTVLWVMSVIWLVNIPFGTAIGIGVMVYLSTHADEFSDTKKESKE